MITSRRLVSLVVLSVAFSLGLGAFTPTYGCGGGQGGTGCRTIAPTLTWLTELRAIVATIDSLMP